MIIGVPLERHRHEHRVGLTPFATAALTQRGHTILVEQGAGEAARFQDHHYQKAGAQTVYATEEIFKRADVLCRVGPMTTPELDLLRPGSVVCAFQHLAVSPRAEVERLMELGSTVIGYEVIRNTLGHLAVLRPFSEMAGQLAVQIAAHYLQNECGGRGVLMGNIPGIAPATVLVIGAGTVGHAATRQAIASGAHVIVIDSDLEKLRALHAEFANAVTILSGQARLERYTALADVVIGAVLIPGGRAPILVTEEMVRLMKPGSVIVDVSIDQGGCVETGRPTTPDNPTFVVHDVVHYCVPNMTANVARTASRALVNAFLPYLHELADTGLDAALADDPGLADGVYLYKGQIINARAATTLGLPSATLERAMQESRP